jgi:hypothetical protein
MTQPDGPINLSHFLKLEYATRDYDDATVAIPTSHNGAHQWVTERWDTEPNDPDNMHSMPGGWSVLRAPADRAIAYHLTAALRVQGGVEGCSTHLMPIHCRPAVTGEKDGVDNITMYGEAAEMFVGPNESHPAAGGVTYSNTHLKVSAADILPAGQLLRFVADYWNAPATAVPLMMVGGTVSGFWGWV